MRGRGWAVAARVLVVLADRVVDHAVMAHDDAAAQRVVGAAGAASAADHRAREFDRLADVVRGALDMEYVYRIIEEGV